MNAIRRASELSTRADDTADDLAIFVDGMVRWNTIPGARNWKKILQWYNPKGCDDKLVTCNGSEKYKIIAGGDPDNLHVAEPDHADSHFVHFRIRLNFVRRICDPRSRGAGAHFDWLFTFFSQTQILVVTRAQLLPVYFRARLGISNDEILAGSGHNVSMCVWRTVTVIYCVGTTNPS